MNSTHRLRFRLRPSGAAVLLVTVVLLLAGGPVVSAAPSLTLVLGLTGLLLLSFLFLLVSLPAVKRHLVREGGPANLPVGTGGLPSVMRPGETALLESDPLRPRFLPGVRLFSCRHLEFGPFRRILRVPLAVSGLSTGEISFPRRGLWSGRRYLELTDPFGLFAWHVPVGSGDEVVVPPLSGETGGDGESGRPADDTASAPRPKEDADELLERRDYRPGDDIRKLDWKQMARTGDLLVRIGDDTIPLRGRVWMDVILPPEASGRTARRTVTRLDRLLESADALVRRLLENGQEVTVRLPGEPDWRHVDESWPRRLAAALPAMPAAGMPPAGEQLWILGRPVNRLRFAVLRAGSPGRDGSDAVMEAALAARRAGLAVILGFPGAAAPSSGLTLNRVLTGHPGEDRRRLESRIYRRNLARITGRALQAGLDVRHI